MTTPADAILTKMRQLELELEVEFAKQRAGFAYGLEHGRIRFEQEIVRRHRALRKDVWSYVFTARPLVVLVAPIIYSLIIPFVLVDLWVSFYQAICFRVYSIAQVKRRNYMVFDRTGLTYLNAVEKLNCAYCSYVTGVIAYVREIGSRTEQYWCPIKHARKVIDAHARYSGFEEYGDGQAYHDHLPRLRTKLTTALDAEIDPSDRPSH